MKHAVLLIFFILYSVSASINGSVDSESQIVYRIFPVNENELETLYEFHRAYSDDVMDFWKEPTTIGYPVDILMTKSTLFQIMELHHIRFSKMEVMIDDVDSIIRNQFDGNSRKNNSMINTVGSFYCSDEYKSYEEIYVYIRDLVNQHSDISRIVIIGQSLEGRDIYGVEISIPETDPAAKRGIYIDGGIHAREWIAPAVSLNILLNLLRGYEDGDAQVLELLKAYDVTIVPVINVDGYTYTWTSNRMWRKTRRPNPGGSFGVDMNRNAPVYFCERGASTTPSSDIYCGPFPNSEPELVDTFNYISGLGNVLVYWNLHSYGQEIILPYAYDNSIVTPDRADHLAAGNELWNGINSATGNQYDRPRPPNGIYSGFAMDYIYIELDVKYSGLIELRDTGRYGFVLPESQICPTSLEIWEGFKLHAFYAIKNP
jgi:murein tripeptide amidase MpaA